MSKAEFGGVVRAVLAAAVAFASGKGWLAGIDDQTTQALIAAGTTLAVASWSVSAKAGKA